MKHRPFVFIDIETTGGSHLTSRVLEIGAIRVEENKIVGTYNQLIHPEESVPPFITNLTGISDTMVKNSPNFQTIALELQTFMTDAIFIAHNVSFDYNFIQMEFRKLGQKFSMDRMCTVRISRILYPNQRRHNLDSVIRAHGIQVNSRHRALDDATVLYEFYQKIVAEFNLGAYAAMNRVLQKSRV